MKGSFGAVAGSLWSEAGGAARAIARSPRTTVPAVLTMALGIGATTAAFSVVDAVLLRPFPFPSQERLALLWERDDLRGQPFVEVSFPNFLDWRTQGRSFVEMAAMPSVQQEFLWTGGPEPLQVSGRLVSAGFFGVLGVEPLLGRVLEPEDDRPGASRVLVVSHGFWQRRLGGSADVVGRRLTFEGAPFTIVGVMPPAFDYPPGAEVWTPVVPALPEFVDKRSVGWSIVLGRLKDGVSMADARAEMDAVVQRLAVTHEGTGEGRGAVVKSLVGEVLGDARPTLLAVLGGVGLVLAVACANVAGLLLVSTGGRRREIGIRQALGASRARVVGALLAESGWIAILGGLLGVLAARGLVSLVVALGPVEVPRLQDASIDLSVLAFALAVSTVSALLAGLAPAWHVARFDAVSGLHDGTRVAGGGLSRPGTRGVLVAAEIGLALVLVVGAGLLARSFRHLAHVPLGFDAEGVATLEMAVPDWKYPRPDARLDLQERILERVAALPGVEAAAAVAVRPLWGKVGNDWPFQVEGQPPEEAQRNPLVNLEAVTPDYFRALGIPVVRGRVFDGRDVTGQPGVAVVSAGFARRYWAGADPVGRRLSLPLPGTPYHQRWLTVIGVVGDVRYRDLRATRLDLYLSHRQAGLPLRHLVARTSQDPESLMGALGPEVRALEPDMPAVGATTMAAVVSSALAGPRFAVQLLAGLALAAVGLAGVGLYGTLAHAVAQRSREIGVRVALGARRADVLRLVLRQGMLVVAAGIAPGWAAAWIFGRSLSALLFEVTPADPLVFGAGAALVALVALLASTLPALRAARVDPVRALAEE